MKYLLLILLTSSQLLRAQFITPNTGVNWTLDSLVANSGGVVTGTFPNFTVNGLITVSATDQIRVLPGSVVSFTSSAAGFETNGVFSAVGTAESGIVFTSPTPDSLGAYMGFRFNDTSIDPSCVIKYARIEYAYYGLRCIDASPTLENCYLFKCRRGANLSSSSPSIKYNKIERSYEYGITLTLGSSPIIEYNELVNNNTQNTSPKNQISVGTQGINSPTIRYNTIHGGWNNKTGGISISALLGGSGSASEIAFNEIYENSYGIALGGGSLTCYVHHNLIYNNKINPDPMTTGSGININGNSANSPIIAHNEIFGNWWGITIQNGSTIQAGPQPNLGIITNATTDDDGYNMIYNNIQGANVYDLFNNCSNDIYAQNNDWRVYDSVSVDGHIVHKTDDPARGNIFFMPFSQYVPVELAAFSLSLVNNSVCLDWSTASEKNNFGFIIDRKKSNSALWTNIGNISGKGTTTQTTNYSFTDIPAENGTYEYRLTQIDFNGTIKVIATQSIAFDGNSVTYELMQNYPNPFNPSTTITYAISQNTQVNLTIFDIVGNKITTLVDELQNAGSYSINFNGDNLVSGVYFYKLSTEKFTSIKKLILLK